MNVILAATVNNEDDVKVHNFIHSLFLLPQDYQRDIDEHRYTYQDIKRLGQEITRDPKTSDTSRIADTVTNLSKNWDILEALLKRRWVLAITKNNLFSKQGLQISW